MSESTSTLHPGTPQSPRWRWTRRLAAWLLGIWLALALTAALIVPPWLKTVLSSQLSKALHREVSIASVAINPLSLSARIEQLSIKDHAGQEQLGLDELFIDLSSLSIAQAGWVVDELRLQAPRIAVARLADGRYDISDLLDEWLAPSDKPSARPRFSVNNIQVLDGTLEFDDRPKGTHHSAKAMAFKLPFMSSMAYQAEVFVEPHFSAVIDGAKIDLQGRSQPFAATHASTLALQLQGLDLARLQPYLPSSIPVRLKAGMLSGDLKLEFSAGHGGVHTARLGGTAQLAGLDLTQTSGAPWLGLDKAEITLLPSDPIRGIYDWGPISLDGVRAGQTPSFLPLRWGQLHIAQAHLDLGARQLSVDSIQGKDVQAHVVRTAQGRVDWIALPQSATPQPASPTAPDWSIQLAHLSLGASGLRFEDRTQTPVAVQDFAQITLTADNLNMAPGQKSSFSLSGNVNQTGQLKARGELQWQPLAARIQLDTQALPVAPLQAYVAPYLNVALVQGQLSNAGVLDLRRSQDALQASYKGSLTLGRFLAVDKVNNTDFLRWKSLYLGAVDFQLEPSRMSLGEVALSDFYSRLILSQDGRLNLADMVRSPEAAGAPATPQSKNKAWPVEIGKVTLHNGQVEYSDHFVRPNYSANVTKLGGSIQNLSSRADTVADLDLRGSYASNAPVHIAAKLNPLADRKFLDLQAQVSSVDLVDFSPYAGKYAGYTIDKGKLTLNATYKLQDRQLTADNQLFIDQLTFGEKVDSPDATRLPVQLAIALLKNNRGEININLPISGSLDDPQFSVSGLVFQVLGNVIVKAVSAPFTLLGSLFGGGDELSNIGFAPGRASLDDASVKKLESLAKAMREREALKLEITAGADPKLDEEGLKRVALERAVELEKRKTTNASAAPSPVTPEEYNVYLGRAYSNAKFPKPRNQMGLTKELPVAEMEKLMLANLSVTEEDLRNLASARAQITQAWLVETGQLPLARIFLLPVQTGVRTGKAAKTSGNRVDFSLR